MNIIVFVVIALLLNSVGYTKEITTCITTIPKSGTHLLLKCLNELHIPGVVFSTERTAEAKQKEALWLRQLNKLPPPNHYKGPCYIPKVGELPLSWIRSFTKKRPKAAWLHWPYTKLFALYLRRKTNANFVTIRDPRDIVVSYAFMVQNGPDGQKADLEETILDLIDGRQKHYIPWGVEIQTQYPLIWELGITNFIKLYLPWQKTKNFYTVRFENLVGPLGGGSEESQLSEIIGIAQHIGKTLSLEEAKIVAQNSFGKSWTFREGKIGGWKKYFTPVIKNAYKRALGANQLLIELGYEKDNDW